MERETMFKSKKHFHNLCKSSVLFLIIMVGGLLLPGLTTTTAFADTPGITGTVSAGALSETASASYTFSGTIGSTPTFTIPLSGSDLTGAAAGWNLTITSTTLTSGSNTIPTTASQITGITASCTTAGTCSQASVTSGTTLPVTVPAATTAPTAVKFFSAAATYGSGVYTVTPTIAVTIPGSTKLGTYTSTYTLAIVSGP
jgi:hypothetical protein